MTRYEVAGDVALGDASCVACALAFGDATSDVVLGGRVVLLAAVENDGAEGTVELAIAAAAEVVPDCLAG